MLVWFDREGWFIVVQYHDKYNFCWLSYTVGLYKNIPIVQAKAEGQRGNITITGSGNGVNHFTETHCLVSIVLETMRRKDDLPTRLGWACEMCIAPVCGGKHGKCSFLSLPSVCGLFGWVGNCFHSTHWTLGMLGVLSHMECDHWSGLGTGIFHFPARVQAHVKAPASPLCNSGKALATAAGGMGAQEKAGFAC